MTAAARQPGEERFRVLFLLGAMRSGTTFLRNALAANAQVLVLGSELNRFWTRVGKAPVGRVACCPRMTREDLAEGTRADVIAAFDRWFRQRNRPSRVAYRVYRRLRYRNETTRKAGRPFYLLNKSTHLLNKIPYLDALFPDARYLLLVRDIYSHAYSLKLHLARGGGDWQISYPAKGGDCWSFRRRAGAASGAGRDEVSFEEIARAWVELNALALEDLERLPPERVLSIGFAELCADLPGLMRRLGSFLGVADLGRRVDTRLVNSLTADPVSAWKKKMTGEEVAAIKAVASSYGPVYERLAAIAEGVPR